VFAQQSLEPKLSHRCYASVSYARQNNTVFRLTYIHTYKYNQNLLMPRLQNKAQQCITVKTWRKSESKRVKLKW